MELLKICSDQVPTTNDTTSIEGKWGRPVEKWEEMGFRGMGPPTDTPGVTPRGHGRLKTVIVSGSSSEPPPPLLTPVRVIRGRGRNTPTEPDGHGELDSSTKKGYSERGNPKDIS